MRHTQVLHDNRCSGCGVKNDILTDPEGDDAPIAGALSICIVCGQPCMIQEDLTLKALSTQDIAKLGPEAMEEIEKVQKKLEMIWKRMNRGKRPSEDARLRTKTNPRVSPR